MIKAGIIGLGKMGISHAAIMGAHPDVEIVGVCDKSSLMLNAFRKYGKTNVYTDYKEMIREQKPDFIVSAVPTKYHYETVKDAFLHDVHVFCEKPLCLDLSEGRELVELAGEKNLVNQVGYHNQFVGTFREMKRLLKKGILGELFHFTGEAYGPVIVRKISGVWRSKNKEGGGCLYDYASHVINLIQEVIGRPVKVDRAMLKKIYSDEVEDSVYAFMTLDNGTSGVLSVNWSDETYRKMSTSIGVSGEKGKIICDATEIKIFLKQESKPDNLHKGWNIKYITELALPVKYYLRGEEYSAQAEAFVECIKNKKPAMLNSFDDALYTDSVIEMIKKSAGQDANG
jgi:predicted dehydrogenase